MIVHVALSIPVTKTFSYSVPEKWEPFIKRFLRVRVPFKNKTLVGFISDMDDGVDTNLKEIYEIVDIFPLMDDKLILLCEWASHYYITPIGIVLKYAIPASLHIEKYLTIKALEGRGLALDNVSLKKAYTAIGKDTVFQHYKEGLIELCDTFTNKPFSPLAEKSKFMEKSERILYIGDIKSRLEYYTDLISIHLNKGGNVLMLLPDYYITGRYFYRILFERFQNNVLWYGATTKGKQRMETYFKARNEDGFLILGNISCTFLPVLNNSLIVVDRHEEDEYRNEEGFKFNAGLLAMKRAEIEHIPVVFGSVAPSMEIFKFAQDGNINIIEKTWLKNKKYSEIITEKNISSYGTLPEELIKIINTAIEKKEIIAIFTPRKDYSSYIQCLDCKRPFLCPVCQGIMSYQKHKNLLICPACSKNLEYKEMCMNCGSNLIRFSQIGAEYLEEKMKNILKNTHIVRITGETIKEDLENLKNVSHETPAIIIGTQTLSKLYGLHANKLILIGWEELLRIAGYRAEEKMFQVFTNLLDALSPEEIYIVMERKKGVNTTYFLNLKTFYLEELKKRRAAEFPPYLRIFLIEVEKKGEQAGIKIINKIKEIIEKEGLTGYVTGPLMQKKKGYRWRIILKGNEELFYKSLLHIYNIPEVRIEADPLYI
jgi:primosomal protein N' (replication factor Y) (superfamily II helicase)